MMESWLGFMGTIIGALVGVLTSAKLINHRLIQLENKVDKHNQLVERMAKVDQSLEYINKEIDELKREGKVGHASQTVHRRGQTA